MEGRPNPDAQGRGEPAMKKVTNTITDEMPSVRSAAQHCFLHYILEVLMTSFVLQVSSVFLLFIRTCFLCIYY